MRFYFHFYQTALYLAIEKENIEIIKMLLLNEKLDINAINKRKSERYKVI